MPPGQRRLTLLYQLFLTHQAARSLMRLAMAGTGMSGEEYAIYSYLYANGPRTLTEAARDLGMPITTLATTLAPLLEAGDVERGPHPRDRRAKLLALTDAGRDRLEAAIPAFSAAYRGVLAQLETEDADTEALYGTLELLREAIGRAVVALEDEQARPA